MSAKKAGYLKNFDQVGEKLLARKDISDEIQRISAQRKSAFACVAESGYRRLAFGSISDAVSLLYMDSPSKAQLENMDLFLVSEIKRPKDGAMEIKFFDRLKALEKLENDNSLSDNAKSLYDAISQSAKAVGCGKSDY
ncbi:MAG: terminase small subunit [Ruminococcus sp.]|nr:terminase small subunit [Ruminococcus sp.]